MERAYNVWLGLHYRLPEHGVRVLGESWYTPKEPLASVLTQKMSQLE